MQPMQSSLRFTRLETAGALKLPETMQFWAWRRDDGPLHEGLGLSTMPC